jgi:peptidoglycan/LPS O-acetylase OafA/YrhL
MDNKHYRPDIDGLRGIAVLSVVGFHFFPVLLPGGFVGVDIFFVISGYLITSIILRELASDTFRFHRFYARRIKRIFPALLAVLYVTWIIGWMALLPTEFASLGKHIVGGCSFTSNFLLWSETGYFNAEAEQKPLLHLWSLGIEEQFYIFFPLALWLALRLRTRPGALIWLLFALSFSGCLYATYTHRSVAFYFPFTRLWELLLGCGLALSEQQRNDLCEKSQLQDGAPRFSGRFWTPSAKDAASCLGFILFASVMIGLSTHTAFPGLWALVPTIGAALCIFAGNDAVLNRLALNNRLLVWVGLIS